MLTRGAHVSEARFFDAVLHAGGNTTSVFNVKSLFSSAETSFSSQPRPRGHRSMMQRLNDAMAEASAVLSWQLTDALSSKTTLT